jgi:hypothetical protein
MSASSGQPLQSGLHAALHDAWHMLVCPRLRGLSVFVWQLTGDTIDIGCPGTDADIEGK